jgi:hypothetical protein
MSPARRDAIADPVLERLLVFYSSAKVDAVESKGVELALKDVQPDEVEQKVRREIAARRDHRLGELTHSERPSHGAVDLRIRVPLEPYTVGRSVVGAEEAVAHVHARLREELAAEDCAEDADENGDLDRAGRVKPPVGVIVKVRARLEIHQRDGHSGRSRACLQLGESRLERRRGLE